MRKLAQLNAHCARDFGLIDFDGGAFGQFVCLNLLEEATSVSGVLAGSITKCGFVGVKNLFTKLDKII